VVVDRDRLISPAYAAQLQEMHAAGSFSGGGYQYVPQIRRLAQKVRARSILDYGCGKVSLGCIADAPVAGYDPAIAGKDAAPSPADLVVCTDVLEHIEPEKLGDVLAHIHGLTVKAAFIVIALRPADKRLPDGRNAHLIIDNAAWWIRQLRALSWSVLVRELTGEAMVCWARKPD
jgi:hypothetical protein